jgi:crossover junction endodeoxyribonuclease RuvC
MPSPNAARQPPVGLAPGSVILGIDPGTRVLGYGAVRLDGQALSLAEAGVIRISAARSLPERLGLMAAELERLVGGLRPAVVVVERAFASKNMATAIRLGEGRGLALAAAARSGALVVEVAPASAKKALTGHGRAAKADVASLVALALGIDAAGAPADTTDALSLALAWLFAQPGLGLRRAPPRAAGAQRPSTGRAAPGAAAAAVALKRLEHAPVRLGQRRSPTARPSAGPAGG